MADLISTYFHAHNMVETEWELRDKELATKKYDCKHGYSQQTNRSNDQTYYSNSQTNHSSNQTNHGNNQTNHSINQTTKQLKNPPPPSKSRHRSVRTPNGAQANTGRRASGGVAMCTGTCPRYNAIIVRNMAITHINV